MTIVFWILGFVISVAVVCIMLYSFFSNKEVQGPSHGPMPIPVVLFVDTRLQDRPRIIAAIEDAVTFINESVGGTLFLKPGKISENHTSGEVIPVLVWDRGVLGRACHYNSPAFTDIDSSKGKPNAIFIDLEKAADLDDSELKFGIAHELGHVIGLEHDDFVNSLMCARKLVKDPEITSKDCEFLRGMYGITDVSGTV